MKTNILQVPVLFFGEKKTLDLKAICFFVTTGFFLEEDTFFKELKVYKSGFDYEFNEKSNQLISEKPYFKWHYNPIERSLSQIVIEFANLFETIINEQIGNKKVILPLSGGLDSRTLAVALKYLEKDVNSYSYEFQDGHDETNYGKKIAKICDFQFQSWKIQSGYLWDKIEEVSKINGCYAEFTNARQMAYIDEYKNLGEIFCLGHMGDLMFDDMGVTDSISFDEQLKICLKNTIKKSGLELGNSLWKSWNIDGDFEGYLEQRFAQMLHKINIPENANAQLRAFKSQYSVARWSIANLSIFESVRPISVPYFDNRMCEFVCSVPEKYLSGRQIQIEYIKMRMPEIAKIAWQDHRPFDLYNYRWNKVPYNLPYRVFNKLFRLASNKKIIQRNWELQFLGSQNDIELQKWLFENKSFSELIPKEVIQTFYNDFKNKDAVYFSHSVSMLLTLSLFSKNNL